MTSCPPAATGLVRSVAASGIIWFTSGGRGAGPRTPARWHRCLGRRRPRRRARRAPSGSRVANWESSSEAGMKWPGRLACRRAITSRVPSRCTNSRRGACRAQLVAVGALERRAAHHPATRVVLGQPLARPPRATDAGRRRRAGARRPSWRCWPRGAGRRRPRRARPAAAPAPPRRSTSPTPRRPSPRRAGVPRRPPSRPRSVPRVGPLQTLPPRTGMQPVRGGSAGSYPGKPIARPARPQWP